MRGVRVRLSARSPHEDEEDDYDDDQRYQWDSQNRFDVIRHHIGAKNQHDECPHHSGSEADAYPQHVAGRRAPGRDHRDDQEQRGSSEKEDAQELYPLHWTMVRSIVHRGTTGSFALALIMETAVRVLVTGVAGFVGSHVAERILAEGHEVVGIDAFLQADSSRPTRRNLTPLFEHRTFTFHEADLRNASLIPLLKGCDAIINEAAIAGLMRSWDDLPLYASCNVTALGRLLDAALQTGVERFIQISTSSVYGRRAVGDETLPTRPISPYGVTKLAAEHLVLAYVESFGLPAVILRYFSIYGPRQRSDMAYHIFIEAMLENRSIQIYGDGLQSRSNTYISDCVDGTIRALRGGEAGQIYNIGGGGSITVREAVDTIARSLGVEPRIEYLPEQPGDQRETRADIAKARSELGYSPQIEPAEGLAAQVAWHRMLRAKHMT
jgi:nucleoside-diphosphate-sugar epimerase